MVAPPGPNLLRVAISTDNHLGFLEKDPVRGCDSFLAFEETLEIAERERADMMLLGGDIFHENRPSRPAVHRCMESLRAHVLGDGEITISVVSDQRTAFAANGGHVNYEDPHYNVKLPVFAIHGNHDDPAREPNTGRPLAALDLLASANLINYFGRCDIDPEVRVSPVLVRKGEVRLALYGLGALRDERLNRMFKNDKVVFERPDEDADAWFNVLMLHQNRGAHGRGTNAIEEGMLPAWMVRARAAWAAAALLRALTCSPLTGVCAAPHHLGPRAREPLLARAGAGRRARDGVRDAARVDGRDVARGGGGVDEARRGARDHGGGGGGEAALPHIPARSEERAAVRD